MTVDLVRCRSIIGCSQTTNLGHSLRCQVRIGLCATSRILAISISEHSVCISQRTHRITIGCQIVECCLVGLTSCCLSSCNNACQSSVNLSLVGVIIKAGRTILHLFVCISSIFLGSLNIVSIVKYIGQLSIYGIYGSLVSLNTGDGLITIDAVHHFCILVES